MITDIEDYFAKGCGRCARFDTPNCSALIWQDGQAALREICLEAGLTEVVKWGCPCYEYAGRNIAIFGAFRDDFRLTFFNAALMKDPEGILEKQGANAQNPSMIRFQSTAEVTTQTPTLIAYLREAMGYAERGIKPPKITRDIPWPDELTDALDADPDLAEAFEALTPGRQKSYVIHLNNAKKSETRTARINAARPKIFAGKGQLER